VLVIEIAKRSLKMAFMCFQRAVSRALRHGLDLFLSRDRHNSVETVNVNYWLYVVFVAQ
jgi:hypothetical protein